MDATFEIPEVQTFFEVLRIFFGAEAAWPGDSIVIGIYATMVMAIEVRFLMKN
jgi:hypothetical protein